MTMNRTAMEKMAKVAMKAPQNPTSLKIIQLKNKNCLRTRNGKEPIKTNSLRQRIPEQWNHRKISRIFILVNQAIS